MAKSLRWLTVMAAVMLALGGIARTQARDGDPRALRERLERRYDIVALSDGVGLRPKSRAGDVRLIEVTAGAVLVNGSAVTGRELRDRLGDDAEPVLRLSYLSAGDLKTFAAPAAGSQPAEGQSRQAAPAEPPLESARPPDVEAALESARRAIRRREVAAPLARGSHQDLRGRLRRARRGSDRTGRRGLRQRAGPRKGRRSGGCRHGVGAARARVGGRRRRRLCWRTGLP